MLQTGVVDLHRIYFYKEKSGKEPVLEDLQKLIKKKDKDSRIKANKWQDYISLLGEYGTSIGEPYLKHLDGEIWELRPIRDRILFAAWYEDSFILLHSFPKSTQKTPRREIEKAKRELEDIKERGLDYE